MCTKPIIHSQEQLTPLYRLYRDMLCKADNTLDERLRGGALQRVDFGGLRKAFDVILLDAFGVLNRGKEAIAGAAQCVSHLKTDGQPFLVVSNNASQSPEKLENQFSRMGFEIHQEEILSSGMAVLPFVSASPFRDLPYYLVGTADSIQSYAPEPERFMVNYHSEDVLKNGCLDRVDYILLCSNRDYYGGIQQRQVESLLNKGPLPILLANPDLVAPDASGGVSAVAGYTAAQWVETFRCPLWGVGKPFAPIFSLARQRFPQVPPERFLMVGDTLDTDILGGAAQGFKTCLTLSGVYEKEGDHWESLCAIRGIRPDFVVQSIAG